METRDIIETIGSITKVDNIKSVDERVVNNTLVVKNIDAFTGVHAARDIMLKKRSHFIILRYRYAPEKINRITSKLQQELNLCIMPSSGELIFKNSVLPCVRIKACDDINMIAKAQNFLQHNDIKLMAYKKIEGTAHIQIFKTFKLIELQKNLYRDLNEGNKFYFTIPKALNWRRFEVITSRVKNKLTNPYFDAALGMIYRFYGPEDVIRIFDMDKSLERALELKKHFTSEVKNEILLHSVIHS